ncbi:MAG: pantetheine-phosphate adenylyltransferase [Thermomicrobiales bacterium]
MTLAIYPGSFDPVTNGHLDVALRAAKLFDHLVICIYEGSNKSSALFPTAERVELARSAIASSKHPWANRVTVDSFSGLAVEYAKSLGASTIVRGLRAVSDFEYEFQYAHMNHHLADDIEMICLMTSSRHSFISSSMIREVSRLGGSADGLVPANVAVALRELMAQRRGNVVTDGL